MHYRMIITVGIACFPCSPQNSPSRPRRIGEKITTRMAAEIGETERKLIVRPGCRAPGMRRKRWRYRSRCSSSRRNRISTFAHTSFGRRTLSNLAERIWSDWQPNDFTIARIKTEKCAIKLCNNKILARSLEDVLQWKIIVRIFISHI